MEQNKNKSVSRSELINTFSNIDEKISDLHQCSAKDFLQLNSYLKDYHQKTSRISENASTIFKMLGGEKGTRLLKTLEEIHMKIQDCQYRNDEVSNEYILTLEKMLARIILLTVSLKNFKQDLTAFKFLVSNYKLISNYERFDPEWNRTVSSWEVHIRDIRSTLPDMASGLERFKSQLYTLINESRNMQEGSSVSYKHLRKDVETCIKLISRKNQESTLQIPFLQQKIENSSQSIANIITHLQYQDIIKQKIDHIRQSHMQIIEDLQFHDQGEDKGSENSGLASYYQKVGDVAGLQIAQLLLVNNEYQGAIEVIIKSFQQIGEDLAAISDISHKISFESDKSEITHVRHIKDKLNEGIHALETDKINGKYLLDRVPGEVENKLLSAIRQIPDLFGKITGHELFKIEENTGVPQYSEKHPRVLRQIISFLNETSAKAEKFSEHVSELMDLSVQLAHAGEGMNWTRSFEQDRLNITLDLRDVLEILEEENLALDQQLDQNQLMYEEIMDNIKNAIHKIDYYDFFEKVIEEVIMGLNDINFKLKPQGGDNPRNATMDNLEDLKSFYTMESERIIHQRVSENKNDNPGSIELSIETDDSAIELF